MRKIPVWAIAISLLGCWHDQQYVDKAMLTCYSGGKLVYEVTTETYKIHKPSERYNQGDKWEIDTDDGKIALTADCIYKPLNIRN